MNPQKSEMYGSTVCINGFRPKHTLFCCVTGPRVNLLQINCTKYLPPDEPTNRINKNRWATHSDPSPLIQLGDGKYRYLGVPKFTEDFGHFFVFLLGNDLSKKNRYVFRSTISPKKYNVFHEVVFYWCFCRPAVLKLVTETTSSQIRVGESVRGRRGGYLPRAAEEAGD